MSDAKTTKQRGRARRPAKTERGRAMLAHLDGLGLNLVEAAARAKLHFGALEKAIHGDPLALRAKVIVALCSRLDMPLSMVCPQVAKFHMSIEPGTTTASVA